jgi:membrane associated rhomboid family serine protease
MFRKPGNGTLFLLGLTLTVSLLTIIYERLGINSFNFLVLNTSKFTSDPYIWKWITTGFIIPPSNPVNLIFSLIGVYFLCSMLEDHLGTKKLLILVFISVFVSFLITSILSLFIGASKWFSPVYPFGLGVLYASLSAAWGKLFPYRTINVMFALPIKGKWFVYIPIVFLALDILYGSPPTEGVISILSAVFIGWNFNIFYNKRNIITQFVTKNNHNIENKKNKKLLN